MALADIVSKKWVRSSLIMILVLACAGVFAVALWSTKIGRMTLDTQAVDIAENAVNQPTVDFYDEVCTAIQDAGEAHHTFLNGVEDFLLLDSDEQRAKESKKLYTAVTTAMRDAQKRLGEINPPELRRADGVKVTQADAMKPALDLWRTWNTKNHNNKVVEFKDVARVAGDASSTARETLSALQKTVPYLNQKTADAVRDTTRCHPYMTSLYPTENDQKTVVHVVVDTLTALNEVQSIYQEATEQINQLNAVSNTPIYDTEELRAMLSQPLYNGAATLQRAAEKTDKLLTTLKTHPIDRELKSLGVDYMAEDGLREDNPVALLSTALHNAIAVLNDAADQATWLDMTDPSSAVGGWSASTSPDLRKATAGVTSQLMRATSLITPPTTATVDTLKEKGLMD